MLKHQEVFDYSAKWRNFGGIHLTIFGENFANVCVNIADEVFELIMSQVNSFIIRCFPVITVACIGI